MLHCVFYGAMASNEDTRTAGSPDPNFQIYLCFGQSNMEGNATPETQDYENVPERFQVMAAVDMTDPKRERGNGTPPYHLSAVRGQVLHQPTISVTPWWRGCRRM